MRRWEIVAAATRPRQRGLGRGRASHWTLRTKLLLVTFLGALIGSTAAWFAFPAIASASTCGDGTTHYNAAVNESSGDHYGVRVTNPGMYIYNHLVGCTEVSSMEVIGITGDDAEVGWIQNADGVVNCNATGDGAERVIAAWVTANTSHCTQHGYLTANQSDTFAVWSDAGSGGSYPWTFVHDGNNVQLADLDFRLGLIATNGERHSSYDSAQSLFDGLQMGHDSSWNPWAAENCLTDSDPDYNNQAQSATHVTVTTNPTYCP
ncbi:MAG: hypothetical protein ACRDLM_02920 [Gaiellaceae bacterium]